MTVEFSGPCSKDCLCASDSICQEALQKCAAYHKALTALETYFKFANFRPGQLEAVIPALHGKDVFVRIPTGGGKSLCMYVVTLSHEPDKVGVIISPLIGLMDEQVYYCICTLELYMQVNVFILLAARWESYLVLG